MGILALDLLGPILAARSRPFAHCADLYAIDSPTLIGQLYAYILEQQAWTRLSRY